MNVRNIALDPGFGGFKAAEVQGGAVKVVTMPSVVGTGSTELGPLDLAGVTGRRRRAGQPYHIAFEGVEFLVGPGAVDYTRPVERLDFQRLSDGAELRALTCAMLFEMVNGGEQDLNLVVGLPVEILQGPDARESVRLLQGWLVGRHRFAVDGQEAALNIRALRPMAQPVGAFFEWGLGLDGQWLRDKGDFMVPVAILDLGFNTLDLFTVQSGRINVRYTGGDTLGMRRAATTLVEGVRRQYMCLLSLHEADDLPRRYVKVQGWRVDAEVLRGELARTEVGMVPANAAQPAGEDDELRGAMDDLLSTWEFEEQAWNCPGRRPEADSRSGQDLTNRITPPADGANPAGVAGHPRTGGQNQG